MLLTLSVTVVCTLPLFLTGALAVQMRSELGFSVAALGVAVAVFRASGAFFAAWLGKLADRLGPTPAMRSAVVIAMCVSLGIAAFARSWLSLCLLLAVGGTANALGQTGANLSLSRAVREQRQGLAFGLKQSALPVGSLIAGLAVPLVALTVGWRWAFVMAAVVSAIVIALIPSSEDVRLRRDARVVNRSTRRGPLLVLTVALFFGMAAASTLSAFTVDGAVAAGIPPGRAGLLLALGGLTAIVVRLVAGLVADRRGGRHLPVVAKMLLVGALGYAAMALHSPVTYPLGVVVAFGMGWGFNGLYWLAIVRLNRATPAAGTGRAMVGGLMGGLVGPTAFGWLVQAFGYPQAWAVTACWAVVGGLTMFWGRRLLSAELAATSTTA